MRILYLHFHMTVIIPAVDNTTGHNSIPAPCAVHGPENL